MAYENLQRTLDVVLENLDHWDQASWNCGSSHCFAGFAKCIKEDLDLTNFHNNVNPRLAHWLDLTDEEYEFITRGTNTLEDLKCMVKTVKEGAMRNADGYDCNGYDEDGYDRDGFDRYERDRDGYDTYGYDLDGYDRDGYDEKNNTR